MELNAFDPKRPTTEQLAAIDIHELLPQQEPFVMVGSLTHFDDVSTVTQTDVSEGNIFVDNGVFSSSGIVENIAQTCAARIGYVNKYILQKGVQVGFIGALRNLQINSWPKVGELLTTQVDVVDQVFGMVLARATVTVAGRQIATTEIKLAIKEM